jgi:predicted 3-demethylubiquinone-9 3-methyltransferase (glyoxalase superfamily)
MSTIAPCLWFDGNAEEAAAFYASRIPDSRVDRVVRSPIDYPGGAAGSALVVEFTLAGRPFIGLNGGGGVPFTNAVSFSIECEDQAEVDRFWDALSEGGAPVACGWLTDRFGMPWQIVPKIMTEMLAGPDRERAARAMQAMMGMVKLDVAPLRAAYEGEAAEGPPVPRSLATAK